jgi:CheY-like chemotaxis protein
VTARSAGLGQGSEFELRLPVLIRPAPGAEKRPAALRAAQGNGAKRRILIVDDNRDAAEILARLLSYCGHQTRLAFDGEEAVEQASQFAPDVVLLDIGLPKLNGYEACRAILINAKEPKPHVVALTGWGQDDDRARSREAGFHAHLTKPISFEELNALLADLPERCAAGLGGAP